MDVRLPNGTIVKNVPDDMDKATFARMAIDKGYVTASEMGLGQDAQQPVVSPPQQAAMPGIGGMIGNMITGADRHTEQEQNLPLVINSPEMNSGFGNLAPYINSAKRYLTDNRILNLSAIPDVTDNSENVKPTQALKANLGYTFGLSDESKTNSIINNIPNSSVSNDEKGNKIIHFPSGDYVLSRAGFDTSDIPQLAANVALGEVLGPARGGSMAGQVLSNVAATGAQAGISQSVGGDESLGDIGMDLAFGVGVPAVGEGVGFGYRWLKNGMTPEREAAEAALRGATQYNADATVFTTDIYPPQTRIGKQALDIADNVPIIGTGGLRAKQQAERNAAAQGFIESRGGDTDALNQGLGEELKVGLSAEKGRISDEYDQSSELLGQMGDFSPTNTILAIDKELSILNNPKVMPDTSTINYLYKLRDVVGHQDGLNFTELKRNRTHLSNEIQSIQKGTAQHLGSSASASLKKVRAAMGEDMTQFAANTDPEIGMRWLQANESYAKLAGDTKGGLGSALNAIEQGKEEKVLNMLTTGDLGTAKQVFDNLSPEGQELARRAIINKMAGGENLSEISPNKLATALSKEKMQRRIKAFFPDAEKASIDDLLAYLNSTSYSQTATGNIKTGYSVLQNVPVIAALSGNAIGVGAALAGGIGGRLYQSPLVRDAKIRAAGYVGDEFTDAIPEALRKLNAAQRSNAFDLKDDPLYQGAILANPNYRGR